MINFNDKIPIVKNYVVTCHENNTIKPENDKTAIVSFANEEYENDNIENLIKSNLIKNI